VAHDRTHSPSEKTTVRVGDNVVRLQRGGSISGVVVDETGKGVSPFVIAIESFLPAAGEGPMPMGRARRVEDDGGNFEWTELPAGRYVLTASAEGRPPSKSDSIDVEAGRSSHHVRIVLPRGGVLSGRVLDVDSRQPVLGAVVALDTATATGANLVASATTDERGAFSLSGVPPQGPFSVRVTRDGYRTKIVSGIEMRGLPTRTVVFSEGLCVRSWATTLQPSASSVVVTSPPSRSTHPTLAPAMGFASGSSTTPRTGPVVTGFGCAAAVSSGVGASAVRAGFAVVAGRCAAE
jgi:hypothetical protein